MSLLSGYQNPWLEPTWEVRVIILGSASRFDVS